MASIEKIHPNRAQNGNSLCSTHEAHFLRISFELIGKLTTNISTSQLKILLLSQHSNDFELKTNRFLTLIFVLCPQLTIYLGVPTKIWAIHPSSIITLLLEINKCKGLSKHDWSKQLMNYQTIKHKSIRKTAK